MKETGLIWGFYSTKCRKEKSKNCMDGLYGIANRPDFKFVTHLLSMMDCNLELQTK